LAVFFGTEAQFDWVGLAVSGVFGVREESFERLYRGMRGEVNPIC
jgi:hypothetical protein